MKTFNSFSDEQLIRLYLRGQANAFDTIVKRHQQKIYTAIFLMVKNRQTAEDIFQELFIRIINSLRKERYVEKGIFLPWAIRIAHNMCIDHFRKQKNNFITPAGDNCLYDRACDAYYPKKNDHIQEQIMMLIDRLPSEQREIIILRNYADMSFKDIAALTNCSINTALGRMRYALLNLRKYSDEMQHLYENAFAQ